MNNEEQVSRAKVPAAPADTQSYQRITRARHQVFPIFATDQALPGRAMRGLIELLRNDVRGEHRVTLGQLAPRCVGERERRERSRRELRLESREVGSVRGEGKGEVL